MEVLPASTAAGVGRLTFRSDLLWRYPVSAGASSSPHQMDLRNQLPSSLGTDPRQWSRESVASFLQWCQFEFDLPQFNMEKFQMNGKALCLLTKADLAERSPGSGDVLHNVLQMLVRDSSLHEINHSPLTAHFPRHHWPPLLTPEGIPGSPLGTNPSHLANVSPHSHLQSPIPTSGPPPPVSFSVTLSPVPSGKPVVSNSSPPNSNSKSNQLSNKIVTIVPQVTVSPAPQSSSPIHDIHMQYAHNIMRNEQENDLHSPSEHSPSYGHPPMANSPVYRRNDLSPSAVMKQNSASTNTPPPSPVQKVAQFSLSEPITEPNSNGRLLWDFLQQLLNDSQQRYTAYIAWKNRDVGVFKIVDPPGLAKLWGIQKNHLSMNYDKMSRALRYYYRVNILRKVQGERHCYQFLRNPSELRSIKNMSLLRQQIPQQQQQQQSQLQQVFVKNEPQDSETQDDNQPTDLSKSGGNNNSSSSSLSSSPTNNSASNQQGMKLQLNMWTQQENLKTDSNSNDSVINSTNTSQVIKSEDKS